MGLGREKAIKKQVHHDGNSLQLKLFVYTTTVRYRPTAQRT